MRSIAILNQKGGVGKTTTAVNLSVALAHAGHRVCLVDMDPQAHASLHLGVSPNELERSVYDVLTGQISFQDACASLTDHLALVPANINLAALEVELAGEVGREVVLRDNLAAAHPTWDYLLIDCPPSLGILTLNSLAAVNEVFLPLQPHFLALHGMSKLLGTIDVVARRLNDNLQLTGVVLCMYESATRLAAEVTKDVADFFDQARGTDCAWSETLVFQTRIRRNIRLAEAPSFGRSIFDYSPQSNGAEDYRLLASEVMNAAAADATKKSA